MLMRLTDLVLTLPGLAVLLTISVYVGQGDPEARRDHPRAPLLDGLRPDRARDVPLAAGEGVRRGGKGVRCRRRPDHHPPHPPECRRADHRQRDADRGRRDLDGGGSASASASSRPTRRSASSSTRARAACWWLVTFPGLVIVLIALCVNFVGDGFRDALDPQQRRVRA